MGQIIKSLDLSVCLSVCVSRHSYGRNFGSISMKLCIVVWDAKIRSSSLGLRSDNGFPYFPLFFILLMYFQWNDPNTALTTLFNRLWWLIVHTTPLSSPGAVLGKIFGGPGPSSFGRQQRLSEITIKPITSNTWKS